MKNELKAQEEVKAPEVEQGKEQVVAEGTVLKLMVKYEPEVSKKTGEVWDNYRVRANLRGRDVRVNLVPKGRGRDPYDNLALVFNGAKELELKFEWKVNKDLNTGEVLSEGWQFTIESEDEDGTKYISDVKPYQQTDKRQLETLINKLLIQEKQGEGSGDTDDK